jgi:hypothetical protein
VFQRQAVDDGGQVAAHAGGEAAQFGQVVGFDSVQPGWQFLAAALGHDLGEGADVLVKAFEVGASGGGVLSDQCVVLGQAVGVGEQRLADDAGLRDGWNGGDRVAPVRVRVTSAGSWQPEGLQVEAHSLGVAFEAEGT